MIKRKVIETVEEFDANGKLTRKVTTETTEDDDSPQRDYVTIPYVSSDDTVNGWSIFPPHHEGVPYSTTAELKVDTSK